MPFTKQKIKVEIGFAPTIKSKKINNKKARLVIQSGLFMTIFRCYLKQLLITYLYTAV
jgi:hypothetical protein